jgi:hypothetical protein
VTPARPGAGAHLQREVGDGAWRTVDRTRVSAAGAFVLSGRATTRPTTTWRVAVPRSGGLAAGRSRPVVLPVR